jgi:ABC-type iron transport system FetAB ATPase subunit
MKKLDITIIKNAQRETATLELDRTTSTLSITFADGMQKNIFRHRHIYVLWIKNKKI